MAASAWADGDAGTFERIGFDDLPDICLFQDTVALRDEYADRGVRFRGPAANDGGGVVNLCAFFLVTEITPPNFIGFNPAAVFADGGIPRDPQTLLFDPPVQFVEVDTGSFLEAGTPLRMTAYDSPGNVLDERMVLLEETATPVLVTGTDIARVEIEAPGARYILDDLLFGESAGGDIELTPPALAVALDAGASTTASVTLHNLSNHDLDVFLLERGQRPSAPGGESPRILVFTEVEPLASPPYTDLDQALASLDLPYAAFYGGPITNFIDLLADGPWDLVIFDHQVATLLPSELVVFDALLAHVDSGGRLALGSWQMADLPDHPLWEALGVVWLSAYSTPEPITWSVQDSPFFTVPNDVPEFTELEDLYVVDGHRVDSLAGTETLAVLAQEPDREALVLGNDGRTLFRAFLDGPNLSDRDADGFLDTLELWRDLLIQMLAEDVPWILAPAELVVPAGGQTDLEVAIDTGSLASGSYTAALELRSNEAVESIYLLPIELQVVGDAVFADGFEAGDTSAWSLTVP